jgi:mannose-6-phosphate isomerase-like protein (cupin superfamily)
MATLETTSLPLTPDVTAPDGSEVRILLGLAAGGMAHFRLAAGETSIAVQHRTVEEIWFVVSGTGEMWRRLGSDERVDLLAQGVCTTIRVGTAFQFRSLGPGPLDVVGVTMPPWPGPGEAVRTEGRWEPTVSPGPS